jgi:hypothetical protein
MDHWHKATAAYSLGGTTRSACGYSSKSVEDAEARAQANARQAVENAARRSQSHDYPYGVRPLAEPVIQESRREDGSLSGLLSVNSRGCVVLNTAAVMFVDVDLPKPVQSVGGLLGGLFGRKAAPAPDLAKLALDKLHAFVAAFPEWGFCVYRTAAGLRYLCTSALHQPNAPETLAVLNELGCDPLYVRLCDKQECFRARVTPKPWRVDQRAYRKHYSPKDVSRKGLPVALASPDAPPATDYEIKAGKFAVCAFIEQVGQPVWHPEAQLLASLHDRYTRPMSGLPLA